MSVLFESLLKPHMQIKGINYEWYRYRRDGYGVWDDFGDQSVIRDVCDEKDMSDQFHNLEREHPDDIKYFATIHAGRLSYDYRDYMYNIKDYVESPTDLVDLCENL